MKRMVLALVAVGVVTAAACLSQTLRSGSPPPAPAGLAVAVDEHNPWTGLKLNNDPEEFRFVIVSDRTGSARAGVFERAVSQINLLQPEFVLSVGDLIEGTRDAAALNRQWEEFDGLVSRLQMPFFYVPGNHDIGNQLTDRRWREKFGRAYYHFVYRNVLFLLLNTEDPPGVKHGELSQRQADYARTVLANNRAVRWTVVAMHKPLWTAPDPAATRWPQVEEFLAGRPHTVFVGHKHRYERFVRQGHRYYILGTTGGGSLLRGMPFGEFDHVVWVTMKKSGPVLANLLLEGIYDEDVPTRPEPEDQFERRRRKLIKAEIEAAGAALTGAVLPGASGPGGTPAGSSGK